MNDSPLLVGDALVPPLLLAIFSIFSFRAIALLPLMIRPFHLVPSMLIASSASSSSIVMKAKPWGCQYLILLHYLKGDNQMIMFSYLFYALTSSFLTCFWKYVLAERVLSHEGTGWTHPRLSMDQIRGRA
jgi:hypothetical protein